MKAPWTPMRWPGSWKDPAQLSSLKGTGIDSLLIDKGTEFDPVRSRARQDGLNVDEQSGVHVIEGKLPGVRIASGGAAG